MKKYSIEGIVLKDEHIGSKVTYVPRHVNGDAGHKECEGGSIMDWNDYGVMVNYAYKKCRTPFDLLVWG